MYMTLPQIVSLISTILLTSIAIIIGIQLIQALKELKLSLGKLNRTLDVAEETLEKSPNQLPPFCLSKASAKVAKLSKRSLIFR